LEEKKVRFAETEEFESLYEINNSLPDKTWQKIFNPIIQQFDAFNYTNSFWYIGDFSIGGIVAAGGDFEESSPLSAKEWLGLNPMSIGELIHPLDKLKMQSYVVYIAQYFSQLNEQEREKVKPSFVFRMRSKNQSYTWRIMHYPKLVYAGIYPHYVMCCISDFDFLLSDQKCTMFINDKREGKHEIFFCEEEEVSLKKLEKTHPLTEREIEVLLLLQKGLISKEIAAKLGISKNTVENHKQNMYSKLGFRKINELINYAATFFKDQH
jgi:DNA-binding CsgD family transcriptional regulator